MYESIVLVFLRKEVTDSPETSLNTFDALTCQTDYINYSKNYNIHERKSVMSQ